MKFVYLSILWIAWCALHSALIAPSVTAYFERRFGRWFRFYRLMFNGVSLATLVPVALYTFAVQNDPFFSWGGSLRIVQILLLAVAFTLFFSGMRRYDTLQFLGIRQLEQTNACAVLSKDCKIDTKGILGVMRHPWYVGGMLVVWARNLDTAAIITNAVITTYFVVGAFLEERKLVRQYGKAYQEYQKQVSMFFPYKWLRRLR